MPDFGFDIELKVHLNSEAAGLDATVTYVLPKHQVPIKSEIDAAIRHCIRQANEAAQVDDFRMVTLEDHKFSTPRSLVWDVLSEDQQ